MVVIDEEGHTSYKAVSTPGAVHASKEETGRATSATAIQMSPSVQTTTIKPFSYAASKKRRQNTVLKKKKLAIKKENQRSIKRK